MPVQLHQINGIVHTLLGDKGVSKTLRTVSKYNSIYK